MSIRNHSLIKNHCSPMHGLAKYKYYYQLKLQNYLSTKTQTKLTNWGSIHLPFSQLNTTIIYKCYDKEKKKHFKCILRKQKSQFLHILVFLGLVCLSSKQNKALIIIAFQCFDFNLNLWHLLKDWLFLIN